MKNFRSLVPYLTAAGLLIFVAVFANFLTPFDPYAQNLTRDYPLIQAYVVWMAIIYVMINLLADLLYRRLDPRVRYGGDSA
ncbi:MAG: ABC transporter permease subunit [Selenomonadaceae bacterium]|nr:ABC transporter permease subunit [Selenomonadaceae bacterium]